MPLIRIIALPTRKYVSMECLLSIRRHYERYLSIYSPGKCNTLGKTRLFSVVMNLPGEGERKREGERIEGG